MVGMSNNLTITERARIQLLHQCAACGWRRYVTSTTRWQTEYNHHPVYGWVTNMEAARADVSKHVCSAYMAAVKRSPRAQAIERDESLASYQSEKGKTSFASLRGKAGRNPSVARMPVSPMQKR